MDEETRTLLASGVFAGPLFVGTFLAEGATRAGYEPLRHPVSSLALGDHGCANFVVAGLLTLAFAVGMRRASPSSKRSIRGPFLVGVWAIGLIGAGIFPTYPVSGYPPGTPDKLTGYSWHDAIHDLAFSLPGFVALAAACFVFCRWFAGRGRLFGTHKTRLRGRVRSRQRGIRAGRRPRASGRALPARRDFSPSIRSDPLLVGNQGSPDLRTLRPLVAWVARMRLWRTEKNAAAPSGSGWSGVALVGWLACLCRCLGRWSGSW